MTYVEVHSKVIESGTPAKIPAKRLVIWKKVLKEQITKHGKSITPLRSAIAAYSKCKEIEIGLFNT